MMFKTENLRLLRKQNIIVKQIFEWLFLISEHQFTNNLH